MEARQSVRRRARQPTRRWARQATRRRARQPRQPTRRRGEGRRACRVRSSGMSGPIVGHVGPDRRACRARSSGMSGPIVGHVGHVGPDFGRSSGRRLSEIALLGFHNNHLYEGRKASKLYFPQGLNPYNTITFFYSSVVST